MTSRMEIAVCDDDDVIAGQVGRLVDKILGKECCSIFTDENNMLKALEERRFDVVIMDIEWDGKEQGIRLAKQLNQLCPDTWIIYLTGYTEKYVQNIFLQPSNLSGFIMKPVDEAILRENLKKIQTEENKRNKERFVFKQKGTTLSLRYDRIIYVESIGHKITVVTKEGAFYCYDRLENLAEKFPEQFVHCHKSYLVNMEEVHCIETGRHVFVMKNGTEIPISKLRYGSTKKRFFSYMRERAFPWGN